MSEQKHTPTPWTFEYDNYGNGGFDEWHLLLGADGEAVGKIYIGDAPPANAPPGYANTDFVLRAVNSHEALVEAAGLALAACKLEVCEMISLPIAARIVSKDLRDRLNAFKAIVDALGAALAKAEGGTDAESG